MGQTVATEVAEQEFARFVETMDLDIDPRGWDDADKKSFDDAKGKLVRAMESGQLVIDEKGQPVFTPSEGDEIIFYEPTGATLMAMDQKKKGHDQAKMLAMLADMTKQPQARFAKMANRDLKVCISIAALFLA